jgi:hypothetical protein
MLGWTSIDITSLLMQGLLHILVNMENQFSTLVSHLSGLLQFPFFNIFSVVDCCVSTAFVPKMGFIYIICSDD